MSPHAARRPTGGRSVRAFRGVRGPGSGEDKRADAGRPTLRLGPSCFLETDRIGSAAYLTLIGELDMSCSDRFVVSLEEAVADYPEHLVIDLRSLTFIDSTGLALLLKAGGLGRQRGFELHIVRSATEIVQAVFETAGLVKFLPMSEEPPLLSG